MTSEQIKPPNYYSKIIFEQSKSLDIEDADSFSLRHPFVNEALLNTRINGHIIFCYKNSKFVGKKGLLFNWLFTVSNNFNINRKYVIPIFIEDNGKFNRRISEYLLKLDEYELVDENQILMQRLIH